MGHGHSTFLSPVPLVTGNVSSASVVVAQANPQRLGLFVFNPSATITLWVAPTGIAATVNGAGSVAVQPLQGVMFGPPNTPRWTAGMNCIASSAGSNIVVILEYLQ
jgi:hypothetical protein